jgi:hypothetical protein
MALRLDKFLPKRVIVLMESFFSEITEIAHIFDCLFHISGLALILTKSGLGYIFLTNSSGHTGVTTCLRLSDFGL